MKFALDIGNSAVKGAVLANDNSYIASIYNPSAVATIADPRHISYTSELDTFIQIISSPLKHTDHIYAVGQKALDLPDYKEFDVTSTSFKANHVLTTALLFGSIAPYLHGNAVSSALAVSIPIVEAKSIGLQNEYKQLLQGSHVIRIYTMNSEPQDITVHFGAVAVLNEGQAGFLGLLDTVDKDFRASMNTVYQTLGETSDPVGSFEDFLIVDIGEGTTDLAVYRNKKFNPDYSYSITRGYGNLLEDAIASAARERLTIESRKDLQRVLTDTNARRAKRREQWLPHVTPTRDKFIETVVDTILKTYGSRDYFDAIIFIGGGFSALTGYSVNHGTIVQYDGELIQRVQETLAENHKQADLVFGIPAPYAGTINERGLTQVLTQLPIL